MVNNNAFSENNNGLSLGEIKELVEKVVLRYVNGSLVPFREKEDVVMSILEKFLNCRQKIDESFEGKSKISTYYIAIFNRMCCEVIRKEQKHWYAVNDHEHELNPETRFCSLGDTEKGVAIQDELRRFGIAMKIFNGQGAKINLFAKYYFNIPITDYDINSYCEKFPEEIVRLIGDRPPKNKAEVFGNLAKLVFLAEGKQVKGDAVRMWLNKKLDALLCRINMNGISSHTRETLQILMEIRKS